VPSCVRSRPQDARRLPLPDAVLHLICRGVSQPLPPVLTRSAGVSMDRCIHLGAVS
jgi:hypothetical protein